MEIRIQKFQGVEIAEIISDEVVINEVQDALDIMANCNYKGSNHIIIRKQHITPDFFDLKTKIAGDILQKFSNYRAKMAIVGDFSEFTSKSLKDFIFESNKTGRILFVPSLEKAKEILSK